MDRHLEFEGRLRARLAQFETSLSVEREAYRVEISREAKRVLVVWPFPLPEVFFDFMDGGKTLLSESIEFYEGEDIPEQAECIGAIVDNFMLNETRIATVGRILKRTELQFCASGQWNSVFS